MDKDHPDYITIRNKLFTGEYQRQIEAARYRATQAPTDIETAQTLEEALQDAIKDNDTQVLKGMIGQFQNPYLYIRELVQNSLDARASKIRIDLGKDERTGLGTICVEDDGMGMDEETIKKYFLTLFASSKEDDRSTIGRFGVGLVSIFAQRPKYVKVETAKEGADPMKVIIGKVSDGAPAKIIKPGAGTIQKGTRLTLYVDLGEDAMSEVGRKLRNELVSTCAYTATPISFGGNVINKDFDIEAPVKVKFGGKGIEAVMALTGNSAYTLMNHRLVILNGEYFTPLSSGLELLINSRYIDYNISRNDVMQNTKYKQIQKRVDKALVDLASESFRWLERHYLSPEQEHRPTTRKSVFAWERERAMLPKEVRERIEKEERELQLVWWHVHRYVEEEKREQQPSGLMRALSGPLRKVGYTKTFRLDERILEAKIFNDYKNNPVSVGQVLDALRKEGTIFVGEDTHLAQEAAAKGMLVIRDYEAKSLSAPRYYREDAGNIDNIDPRYKLLMQIGTVRRLSDAFHVSQEVSRSLLSTKETEFLEQANAALRARPGLARKISSIEIGNFKMDVGSSALSGRETPIKPYASTNRSNLHYKGGTGYGARSLHSKKTPFLERLRQYLHDSDTILINPAHPYIADIIRSPARIDDLLTTLAAEVRCPEGFPAQSAREMRPSFPIMQYFKRLNHMLPGRSMRRTPSEDDY